jgi:hypothetical protein
MLDAGLKLSQTTSRQLRELKKANPEWHDSWAQRADESHDSRAGWVKKEIDPEAISNLPVSEIIPRCDDLSF